MNNEVGSDYPGPTFPRRGEQWFECHICGFDYGLSEARRHYRTKRLVCKDCDDLPTHFDYMAEIQIPSEAEADRREAAEQTATCQGEVTGTRWNEGRWYEGRWYDPGDQDCSGEAMGQKGK